MICSGKDQTCKIRQLLGILYSFFHVILVKFEFENVTKTVLEFKTSTCC
jgi:hypothetical protein